METYERDPKHPDAHPIIPSGESKRIVYDHNLLSEGQKRWEASNERSIFFVNIINFECRLNAY